MQGNGTVTGQGMKDIIAITGALIIHAVIACNAFAAWKTVQDMPVLTDSLQTDTGSQDRQSGLSLAEISGALKTKLNEYLHAIGNEPFDVQCREADFLIESCTDPVVRQAVALTIFDYYRDSRLMGAETVAVHLCDKWFIPGKISMRSQEELMAAKVFAGFNRSSLIGMDAPELCLRDTAGKKTVLFPEQETSDAQTCLTGRDGRFCILYFYDTSCARCKIETIMLRNVLENRNFPVDLYAVYTGDDREAWTGYIREQLGISAPDTKTVNLWDPDFTSDFQIRYGVTETPRMFLVTPDGKIAGRGLDSQALEQMLDILLAPAGIEYGSDESEALYSGIFNGTDTDSDDIRDAADHIEKRTLEQARDTMLFKQMTGDLLYYLSGQRGQAFKYGAEYVIRDKILSRPGIWNTPDDTLKIVSFAEIMEDLLGRASVGTEISPLKVHATLKTGKKARYGEFRLDRLHRDALIIFHTEGCEICKAELAAADSLKDSAVLMIDMDEIFSSYPEEAKELLDTFDLTSLPFIISTDRKGIITGKYLSLVSGR